MTAFRRLLCRIGYHESDIHRDDTRCWVRCKHCGDRMDFDAYREIIDALERHRE
jgi:hypothetical protein